MGPELLGLRGCGKADLQDAAGAEVLGRVLRAQTPPHALHPAFAPLCPASGPKVAHGLRGIPVRNARDERSPPRLFALLSDFRSVKPLSTPPQEENKVPVKGGERKFRPERGRNGAKIRI
eukprot:scaffold225_cov235-Pinguiococcus_pyrenoidosus.AAC.17